VKSGIWIDLDGVAFALLPPTVYSARPRR